METVAFQIQSLAIHINKTWIQSLLVQQYTGKIENISDGEKRCDAVTVNSRMFTSIRILLIGTIFLIDPQ